jgi:hypothetical protein
MLVDGDAVEMIAARASQVGAIDIRDDGGVSVVAVKLPAGEAWSWVSGQSVANPLAGVSVATIRASNGSTTAATLHVGVLYQSVA